MDGKFAEESRSLRWKANQKESSSIQPQVSCIVELVNKFESRSYEILMGASSTRVT